MKNIITQIREITGLSRAEMSRRYKIPVRTLENWENGIPAPDYTIDLLARAVLEDSGRYEKVEYTVVFIDRDEWDCLTTKSITEAIARAEDEMAHAVHPDKAEAEIRVYQQNAEHREESGCWDCDLIEWK
jgi:transcriptional regulator with XRE-family HTH domain